LTFVPHPKNPFNEAEKGGQKIRLKKDITTTKGTFLTGSILTYVRPLTIRGRTLGDRGLVFKDDESGEEVLIRRHNFPEDVELIKMPENKPRRVLYYNHKPLTLDGSPDVPRGQFFEMVGVLHLGIGERFTLIPLSGDFDMKVTKQFLEENFTQVQDILVQ